MLSKVRLNTKFNSRYFSFTNYLITDDLDLIKKSIDNSVYQYDYSNHIDKLDFNRQKKLLYYNPSLAKFVNNLHTELQIDIITNNFTNVKYINNLNKKTVNLLSNQNKEFELLLDRALILYYQKHNIQSLITDQKFINKLQLNINNIINIVDTSKVINNKILQLYSESFIDKLKNNNINTIINSKNRESLIYCNKLIKDFNLIKSELSYDSSYQIQSLKNNPMNIENMYNLDIETIIYANNINKDINVIIEKFYNNTFFSFY